MIEFTYTKGLCRIIHGKKLIMIQKRHDVHIISLKKNLRKYLYGMLYIDIAEEDL